MIGGWAYLGHECAPKVVEEQVGERRVRSQILVVLDGRDVVKDESALQGVPVDGGRHRAHDQRRQPQSRPPRHDDPDV